MASPLLPTSDALAAVAGMANTEWGGVEMEAVLASAVEVGRMRAQLDGALVHIAERLSSDAAYNVLGANGWASAKDFLTFVTGGHKGAGGGLVRLAEHTADLPELRAAMSAGEISLAQGRAIASRVEQLPRHEPMRTAVASDLQGKATEDGYDAGDLANAFAGAVETADPDRKIRGEEKTKERQEKSAHMARHLAFAADDLGGVKITGYGTVEDTEQIKAVLMPLSAPVRTEPGACGGKLREPGENRIGDDGAYTGTPCNDRGCSHDGRDRRDHGARFFDALVEACRRLQHADGIPHSHGTTARITVTVSYEDLVEQLAAEREGLLPGGGSLSASAVRRLACDGEIIPVVLGSDSQILDVGRTQRLVTTALWLALIARDQHCTFPGCKRLPLACDAHHIRHWADGGATCLDNLALVCARHHTIAHKTPWALHLDPVTRSPVWTPPPKVKPDLTRFTYRPGRKSPPRAAA